MSSLPPPSFPGFGKTLKNLIVRTYIPGVLCSNPEAHPLKLFFKEENALSGAFYSGSGAQIRTEDLQVMSLTVASPICGVSTVLIICITRNQKPGEKLNQRGA